MEHIRDHLSRTGETQKKFAERVGISQKHLSRIINGHVTPSPPLAAWIAKLMEEDNAA